MGLRGVMGSDPGDESTQGSDPNPMPDNASPIAIVETVSSIGGETGP